MLNEILVVLVPRVAVVKKPYWLKTESVAAIFLGVNCSTIINIRPKNIICSKSQIRKLCLFTIVHGPLTE